MGVIDDYISKCEPSTQIELKRIYAIARRILPGYEEIISYGMPTIRYKGKSIIGFSVYKNHIGIYPFSGHVIPKIKELEKYDTTKGAIREKPDNLLADSLIEKIIRERMRQADI